MVFRAKDHPGRFAIPTGQTCTYAIWVDDFSVAKWREGREGECRSMIAMKHEWSGHYEETVLCRADQAIKV